MESQLTQLNRPSNPVSQLPCAQPQGSASHERVALGLGYPHPFNSQHPLGDHNISIRDISGRHSLSTNPNPLLGGTFGNQWNSTRWGSQDAEEGRSSPRLLGASGPGGSSSQTSLSDIPPAGQLSPRCCDSRSQPSPPYFHVPFNPWVPSLHQEASTSVEFSPQGDQPSKCTALRPFFTSEDNQNKSEISQHNPPAEDKKSGNLLDFRQPWDVEKVVANASDGHIPAGSSVARKSLEERKTKRWRRKVTDVGLIQPAVGQNQTESIIGCTVRKLQRRREQNIVHQRAFRQRRELMLKQKDLAISNLKERLVRSQVAVEEQSEMIRILEARLGLVKTFRLSTAT